MRTRDAWLAALAATLGIAEEACRANDAAPVAREVPSASSASVETTSSAAPSASAIASVSAAPTSSAPAVPSGSLGLIGIGTIGYRGAACGVSTHDLGGATGPRADVTAVLNGGAAGDARIVATLRARFRNCANQALKQNPSQQGDLVVSALVEANGSVKSATAGTNVGISEACATCMVRAVQNAQFPPGADRMISIAVHQTLQSP